MEWLSELVKHITISRSFTGAVFVTSAVLLTGPKWLPEYFEPLPKEWVAPVTGALIFAGALLFFWLVPAVWNTGVRAIIWFPQYLRSKTLTENEQALMLVLADLADESLDLRTLNYASGSLTKLAVLELSSSLSRKGLVEINSYEENLISLSPGGRRRALEIKRNEQDRSK